MTYEEAINQLRKMKPIGAVCAEAIDIAIKALTEAIIEANTDRCKDCAFVLTEEWEMPCLKCKRNCKDYWRAKVK